MRRLITAIKRYRLAWLRADLQSGMAQYAKWKAETESSIAALELDALEEARSTHMHTIEGDQHHERT